MRQIFTCIIFLLGTTVVAIAQSGEFVKSYEHFEESRGDYESEQILTLPYEETVVLHNALNSRSGLGPTFNYYGTMVVVDQMDVLPSGDMLLVLRREDGRNFYGYRPTIKAVLSNNTSKDQESANNN